MSIGINHYWVEGKCEQKFVQSSSLLGKAEIIDLSELSENNVRKIILKLGGNKKNVWINIIFDTDVLINNSTKLNCFKSNLDYLTRQGFNLRLMQQHYDFEDEIMKCNNISTNQFNIIFNVRNKSEFKSTMISEKSMYDKISKVIKNFSIWDSHLISHLNKFEDAKCNFTRLPKKPMKK
ncbi:hypothetical protein I9054_011070 [Acinetobacter bereziniae]|uniref:Uncharacterized protein n=1 Tax=Acinetobacter bereziniae TaxID=106648 RepID=A0A8I1AJK4_ACIBZ|nr:hypothetical protein [Acinetobacter bereziniae]QQC82786.1 hypothetical protein I9190_10655 [Acinetobacter bereziniae]UUN95928.1 hypothetical protein I9054_011070 [Acinetobacter bereziniae]